MSNGTQTALANAQARIRDLEKEVERLRAELNELKHKLTYR